jgi:hypothetical protein
VTQNRLTSLRTLGVAHIVIAILLLPTSMFLSFFSVPIVIPALLWLAILGIRLWRPDTKLQTTLRYTHFVLAPFAILLVVFGICALRDAQRSAEAGGGLLGAFGLIPLAMGLCAGVLSLVSLYVAYSTTFEKPGGTTQRPG